MKRALRICRTRCLTIVAAFCLAACWTLADRAWGVESSGLILTIHPEKTQYVLGEPVQLIMVLKYDEGDGQPIITKKGFSENLELHQFLSITDPGGKTYRLGGTLEGHVMIPPDYVDDNDEEWRVTETLGNEIPFTETIHDLTALVPVMKNTTGWFTLKASISFVRHDKTQMRRHAILGDLGKVGAPENWVGTIQSNQAQVFISPGLGAQFEVQILDQNSKPAPGVPVKVFRTSEIPLNSELSDVWSELPEAQPVLVGTTNLSNGTVKKWGDWPPCQRQDKYTVIAFYNGEFRQESVDVADAGWASECSGFIQKQIAFGEPTVPFPPLSAFSALALNSIWVKADAVIFSGHIGVMDTSPGLWLDSGVEVSIGLNARAEDGVRIYGDSVKLWRGATVDEIYYNNLQNNGTIRGEAVTPLSLPLPVVLPPFPEITPGTGDVNVRIRRTTTLNPGKYRDVSVGIRGTLRLKEGVYQFRNLNLGANSQLVCLGPGPTEIRIKQRIYPGLKAMIGPTPQSGLSAKDVFIFVGGINGNTGELRALPKAAVIGIENVIKANMYVPNGTLWIREGSVVEGSFIAKDVIVGVKAKVKLNSAF
jgi:hypothetical protein